MSVSPIIVFLSIQILNLFHQCCAIKLLKVKKLDHKITFRHVHSAFRAPQKYNFQGACGKDNRCLLRIVRPAR